MDSFVEQIVVKKTEAKDNLKRFGFFLGGAVLCWVFLMASMIFQLLMPVFLFAGFGAIWGAWYLFQTTFIEYEYIVTNNELDVDKILARKKRKRLITIKIDKAEEWGEYTDGKNIDSQVTVQAHDCGYVNLWYIVTHHDKYGKTAVFFSPNRAVLETINKAVPYALRKKELREKKKEEEIDDNSADNNQNED
jgi:hypothetical protein